MHEELENLLGRMRDASNWVAYRNELVELSPQLNDEADRVVLLAAYKALMDTVEPNIQGADLPVFRKARLEEYRRLLIEECIDGDKVDPARLDRVTSREVAAGRLAADDDLRELGQIGGTFLAQKPSAPRRSLLGRLFGPRPKPGQ
jgi:hypothetical protein